MKFGKLKKAKVIGFAGFDGGVMKQMADVCLVVPVFEEPYATPLIEGFHSLLAHGITFDLKERIKKFSNS